MFEWPSHREKKVAIILPMIAEEMTLDEMFSKIHGASKNAIKQVINRNYELMEHPGWQAGKKRARKEGVYNRRIRAGMSPTAALGVPKTDLIAEAPKVAIERFEISDAPNPKALSTARTATGCHWPFDVVPVLWCGAERGGHGTYCEYHARVAKRAGS